MKKTTVQFSLLAILFVVTFTFQSCEQQQKEVTKEVEKEVIIEPVKPEYFLLRPDVEKAYAMRMP